MRAPITFLQQHKILLKIAAVTLTAALTACGGGGGGGGKTVAPTPQPSPPSSVSSSSSSISSSSSSVSSASAIFPEIVANTPDALASAINFAGGYSVKADIPAPADANGGTISVTPEIAITAGGNTQFDLEPDLPEGYYVHAYLIQIEGSETSFIIPVDQNGLPVTTSEPQLAASDFGNALRKTNNMMSTKVSQRTPMSCSGYPNIGFTAGGASSEARSFSAPATVQAYVQANMPPLRPPVFLVPSMSREREHWTAPATVNIKAVEVGNGKLQITLTWNSTADVDLHLDEPDGNTIYYANEESYAGDGFLDVDDIDGYGPENIFFENNIPTGSYTVKTHMYYGDQTNLPTNYTVTVKRDNMTQTFNGTLSEDDEEDIVTTFTMGSGSDGGTGTGNATGPGSTTPGSYATKSNTLLNSQACQGYTNTNFMEFYAENVNGPDVQLHSLCAGAFNYYSMYLNAIRQGYTEAEANITYRAFSDAALVATSFYENAQ